MILKQNLSQRRPCSGLLRTPGQIWTMRHVWQCLNHRFKATARNGKGDGGPIYRLLAPHNYYMPNISESEWEMNVPIVEADPVVIPDLIEAISRHLRPLPQDQENYPQSSPEVDAFRRHLGRLPVEVMDLIETFIHPLDEPTLSCNRILSPSFWRDGLVSGRLIPFLWDLVPTSAHAQSSALGRINWFKAVTSEEGQQWDWELLVRQLSQPGAFEDGQLFSDVPIGLKNRRRIWRLVEDMYLGDVQPTKKNLWGMAPIPVPVPLPE
ncbi:MAG: hypothetical protein M1820_004881 [Bogoriella megaspora]|nr:MAG: hypothetical protein M1820_004881 [Bogoriella megaspora]